MRNLLLLTIAMMFLTKIIAQDKNEQKSYYKDGGIEGFQKYISNNFKLPESRKLVDTDGRIYIVFVVDSTGDNQIKKIHNALTFRGEAGEFLKSSFIADCETEIRRIFAQMPRWTPGTQNNVKVRAKFTFPISIKTR